MTERSEPEGGPDTSGGSRKALEAVLVTTGLVLAVGLRSFEPVWHAAPGLIALGLLSALAYLVGWTVRTRGRGHGLVHAFLLAMVVSQPVLLALWVLDLSASRIVLAGELAVLFMGLWVAGSRPSNLRLGAAVAFVGVTILPLVSATGGSDALESKDAGGSHRFVFTSYHDLSVTRHEILHEQHDGGGLARLPDGRLLLVTGSGAARWIHLENGGEEVRVAPVELDVPFDVGPYVASGRRQPRNYRVFDALYTDGKLYITHVQWNQEQDCYTLRLLETTFDGEGTGSWITRFETRPCVPLPHVYNTSGGRMALRDDASLILATGTFGIDQVALEKPAFAGWRNGSDYGKILLFDTTTWEHTVLSTGHRNPGGLLVTDGEIWNTEHGPHGGDELNLVVEGSDYGWPFASYGTDYGRKTLEQGKPPGDHSGFARPVYAWTPSIGISNLIAVDGPMFPLWKGDLLVASLSGLGNGEALFRVRLREGRVVSSERIPIGSRIRDLLQLDGGPIVLWDGTKGLTVVRPADHVFSSCSSCHNVRNAQHAIGPDLYGVVGESVARHADYDYSQAMLDFGGTWSTERLNRFLENPSAVVPGTTMDHAGIEDASVRSEIIAFLGEVSAGRPEW